MYPTRKELIDCIKNLMGVFDTPVARRLMASDFSNEVRQIGRDVLERVDAPENRNPERIICAAITYKGRVVVGGFRHSDCIENLRRMLKFPGIDPEYEKNLNEWIDDPSVFQFISSENKLYSRFEAYKVAKAAGQLRIIHDDDPQLTSEDLY